MRHIFLALLAIIAISCDKQETAVDGALDFVLFTAPSSNTITTGQTIEIACELQKSYFYAESAEFTLRYEQVAGSGTLSMEGERLKSGSSYQLPKGEFTMHYTAQGNDHHSIKLTVLDQFNNHEYQTIQFTNL